MKSTSPFIAALPSGSAAGDGAAEQRGAERSRLAGRDLAAPVPRQKIHPAAGREGGRLRRGAGETTGHLAGRGVSAYSWGHGYHPVAAGGRGTNSGRGVGERRRPVLLR